MINVTVVLFDDFEMTDAFGPAQLFSLCPEHFHVKYCSVRGGIIAGSGHLKVWTEYLIPEEVEGFLLFPGGNGALVSLEHDPETLQLLRGSIDAADQCIMVGTGSAIVAQTGLLYHRRIVRAADLPEYYKQDPAASHYYRDVMQLPDLKWLQDGKFCSCADSRSGIDLALHVLTDAAGLETAVRIAHKLGYPWSLTNEVTP